MLSGVMMMMMMMMMNIQMTRTINNHNHNKTLKTLDSRNFQRITIHHSLGHSVSSYGACWISLVVALGGETSQGFIVASSILLLEQTN